MGVNLQWPVHQNAIIQNFMENKFFNYQLFGHPGHEGVDFPVAQGTEVYASAPGVAAIVDLNGTTPYEAAYGTHLWLRHDQPNGVVYRTLYAHLSQIRVTQGQSIAAGQLIALSGNTGRSTGPHLHFSLKKDGASAAGETTYRVVGNIIKVPNTTTLWGKGETGTFKWDYIDPTPFFVPPPANIPVQNVPPVVVQSKVPAATSSSQPTTQPTAQPVVVPTATTVKDWQPDHPLRSLHGEGAADWMLQNSVQGWAVEPVYSVDALNQPQPQDYTKHMMAGIRVIVRWAYSKSKTEGGQGTFPKKAASNDFINWAIKSISDSKGVWGHIIGNEPNRIDQASDAPITPQDVITLYNAIWQPLPKGVRLSPPAIDPLSSDIMDPRDYWLAVLKGINGAEFFALHAYGYGSGQAASNMDRSPKYAYQYQSFRMWEPFAEAIYNNLPNYRHIPLLITETNHFRYGAPTLGWDDNSDKWVQDIFQYVYNWNHGDGDQFVHSLGLYALPGDVHGLNGKTKILQALQATGDKAI